MEDRCMFCGDIIPEGRQVCPTCEEFYRDLEKALIRGLIETHNSQQTIEFFNAAVQPKGKDGRVRRINKM